MMVYSVNLTIFNVLGSRGWPVRLWEIDRGVFSDVVFESCLPRQSGATSYHFDFAIHHRSWRCRWPDDVLPAYRRIRCAKDGLAIGGWRRRRVPIDSATSDWRLGCAATTAVFVLRSHWWPDAFSASSCR